MVGWWSRGAGAVLCPSRSEYCRGMGNLAAEGEGVLTWGGFDPGRFVLDFSSWP
jgi:hypothetical protein